MKHYRCGLYFIAETQATQIASTTKLFPTHCKTLSISEEDHMLLAVKELVRTLGLKVTVPTNIKLQHNEVL